MRRRAFLLLVLTAVGFAAISLRLADIQMFAARRYNAYGRTQDTRITMLPGIRGAILDRAGHALALTEQQPDVIADPDQITNPTQEATALAPLLAVPTATLASQLRQNSGYVDLAGRIPETTAAQISRLGLAGISIGQQPERFYPAGPLARPLLGSLNAAGDGASGLEYAYNQALAGRPGRLVQQVDPQGRPVAGGTLEHEPARLGDDLVLSLDEPLQYQTEQALGQAIVASHARSGTAMVMNTRTGGLLAVADLTIPPAGTRIAPALPITIGAAGDVLPPGAAAPVAQPVESSSADAFTQVYEPGSVAKLVTVSAALATGAVTPGQVFTIPNAYTVDGIAIHDAENHGTEALSVTGIVAQSSNIGAVQIAQHLGGVALYHYLGAYGLGSSTPVGFPGESSGLIPPPQQASPLTLATMAYGEGLAVTAAQMITAYNTIANAGMYVPPHLVKAIIGPRGHDHPIPHPAPHRVVPASIAQQMTSILEQVVATGTGTSAAVAPYAVAGKTGTAQYRGPGGYVPGYTVASFAGYAPAQDPAVTVMVVIDHTPDYGAQAAAPAFSAITRDALQDLTIAPDGPQPAPHHSTQPQTLPAHRSTEATTVTIPLTDALPDPNEQPRPVQTRASRTIGSLDRQADRSGSSPEVANSPATWSASRSPPQEYDSRWESTRWLEGDTRTPL